MKGMEHQQANIEGKISRIVFNEAAADRLARERRGENIQQPVSSNIPIDHTWLWVCGSIALIVAVITMFI